MPVFVRALFSCDRRKGKTLREWLLFTGVFPDPCVLLCFFASQPTIGNGYISHAKGVRSDTMHVSGVFNGETTSPSHRASIPATLSATVANSITTGVLLDVRNGIYHRRGTISGSEATYELRWYAHRELRSLYILELDAHLNGAASAVLKLEYNTLQDPTDFKFEAPVQLGDGSSVQCGTTTTPETSDGPSHRVCVASTRISSELTLKNDTSLTFLTATRTSLDSSDVQSAAVADLKEALQRLAKGTLRTSHTEAWATLWESGIEVDRSDVAAAINASMFAILSSVRDDWAYGLAPGGLTNYYNGHSFWDTETWMYPPLLFLHPSIARSLVDYRFQRLDGAHRKAQSYSPPYSGAMFPWESAFSGVETCPTFAATGLREDHISGDISFAIWQQWNLLQDRKWLRDVAFPILVDVADFWVSRSTKDTTGGSYHIRDVIPPDEYVDHVDDSVYTNFVASLALQYAVLAAKELNANCSQCDVYSAVSKGLVMLFDTDRQIHPEYAGYPGNLVKQADVVLLHFPLGMEMSEEIRRNDLEFYSARTDAHGPAMTWGMHSIGYLDLQDYPQAAKFFNMSFQDNMHAPLQVWTETPDGNAVNFITGAGGFLQTVIAGYPGVRIEEATQSLRVQPVCMEGATSMKLRGLHQGQGGQLDVQYWCAAGSTVPSKLEVTARSALRLSVKVVQGDRAGTHVLRKGESFALGPQDGALAVVLKHLK